MKKMLFLFFFGLTSCSTLTDKENVCERTCLYEGSKLVRTEKDYCVCESPSKKENKDVIKLLEIKPKNEN